ncbi:MAG TPA: universal stress protein [Anaerolineae bacterium]|nr:universal stress protein [Anaerolineae bacterium]
MFKHVLVPTDFSERNKQALEIALDVARSNDGQVSLLHVIKLIAGGDYDEFADFYHKLEQQAQEKMTALMVPYKEETIPMTPHITIGNRVEEIIRFAEEQDVDLIVMASHKIDLEHPDEGWGTISQKVGLLAQCPILLVK